MAKYGNLKANNLIFNNDDGLGDIVVPLTTVDGKANTTGATFTGNVVLDNDKEVRLSEADGSGSAYVGLKAPTDMTTGGTTSYTLILPDTSPSTNKILKTDSSTANQLTWADDATDVAAANLTGTELASNIVTSSLETCSSLTSVGTIGTGTWGATDVAVAHGGTGASDASTARTNLGVAIGSDVQSYDADTAKLDVDQTWTGAQGGAIVDYDGATGGSNPSVAATTDIDFSLGNNFYLDLADATVSSVTASNATAGQSGSIIVRGHATNQLAGWSSDFKGSGGTFAPTFTADAAKYDRVDYFIHGANDIQVVWTGNY